MSTSRSNLEHLRPLTLDPTLPYSFLYLPAEIRIKIYAFCARSCEGLKPPTFRHSSRRLAGAVPHRGSFKHTLHNLLLVSKLVSGEVREALRKEVPISVLLNTTSAANLFAPPMARILEIVTMEESVGVWLGISIPPERVPQQHQFLRSIFGQLQQIIDTFDYIQQTVQQPPKLHIDIDDFWTLLKREYDAEAVATLFEEIHNWLRSMSQERLGRTWLEYSDLMTRVLSTAREDISKITEDRRECNLWVIDMEAVWDEEEEEEQEQ